MLLANKLMRDAAKVAVKMVDCKALKDDPEGIDAMFEAMKAEAKEVLLILIEGATKADVDALNEFEVNAIYATMVERVAIAGAEAVK